jgi:hypothetical protein
MGLQNESYKISTKRERGMFGKTSEMMEGFCSVISVTGVNRPNTGKNDGDEVVCVTSKNRELVSFLDVYQQTQ